VDLAGSAISPCNLLSSTLISASYTLFVASSTLITASSAYLAPSSNLLADPSASDLVEVAKPLICIFFLS